MDFKERETSRSGIAGEDSNGMVEGSGDVHTRAISAHDDLVGACEAINTPNAIAKDPSWREASCGEVTLEDCERMLDSSRRIDASPISADGDRRVSFEAVDPVSAVGIGCEPDVLRRAWLDDKRESACEDDRLP